MPGKTAAQLQDYRRFLRRRLSQNHADLGGEQDRQVWREKSLFKLA